MSTEQTPPTAEELAAWEQEAQQMRASCTCDYCRAHDPHWRLTRLLAALTAERERAARYRRLLEGAYVRFPMPSDEPVQYVGIHPVRWNDGREPTAGFREIDVDAIDAARTPEPRDA